MLLGFSILDLLCLLGILQGILLAAVIGSLGGDFRRANRLLGAALLAAATALGLILLSHRWDVAPLAPEGPSWLDLAEFVLWSISGPIGLLYATLVARRDRWPARAFWWHFVPGVALGAQVAVAVQNGSEPWLPPVPAMMLYQLAYTVLVFRVWLRSRSADRSWGFHRFWVPTLVVVLSLQHASQVVRWLYRHEPALRDVVPFTGAACFVAVTLIGLRKALPLVGSSRRRYSGSSLAPERGREVAARLRALMEQERPFLDSELSLDDLAGRLEVPKTHLSQVLNETIGRGFADLVASYRVRESEALLRDPDLSHLTIEAVARRSGFRSRSAFYEAFRKVNGMTPADYRKRGDEG